MSKSPSDEFRLDTWDYVILVAVIGLSTAVGLYYVWRARKLTNTLDFLVSNRKIGVSPLAMSTFATIMTPRTILATPSEVYANGIQMILLTSSITLFSIFVMYAIVPVFYKLNLSTIYQYTEYRFNRSLRIIQAFVFLINFSALVAAIVDLTAQIFSDATGLAYWWSMAILFGICAVYTSLGGFTSVIWTDFILACAMFAFIVTLVINGTIEAGGVSEIWNRNAEGNRTVLFRMSPNNESNYTFWSLVLGGMSMGLAYSINQPTLQRCNSNKTVKGARATYMSSRILMYIVQLALSWYGMVIYARYQNCDPVKNGQVRSRDQIAILFATELFNGKSGLVGLFLAGIIATSISTLSSVLNSFSTVVIIDFVKIFFPKLKYWSMMLISKFSGIAYGVLIVAATLVIDKFGGLQQATFLINGSSYGPLAGVFTLGFFFPWATTAGAYSGLFCSLAFIWWISIGRLTSRVHYKTLLLTTEACVAPTAYSPNQTFVTDELTTNISEAIGQKVPKFASELFSGLQNGTLPVSLQDNANEVFLLYRFNPLLYTMTAILIVVVVGMVVSIATGTRDPEIVNAQLISPFTWRILRCLPVRCRKWLGFRSSKYLDEFRMSAIWEDTKVCLAEPDIALTKRHLDIEDKCNHNNANVVLAS